MSGKTIVASVVVHAAVAVFLISRAETNQKRRAITVAVPNKEKKAEKPKPPPAPKPVVSRPPPKPAAAKPEPAPEPVKVAREARAPVETKIALSNADLAPGGIALAGTPKLDKASTAKVASVVPEGERRRKHELGAGPPGEEACDEEPSKPEPVFKTEIEYTAEARANNVEGRLKLRVVVAADGSVLEVVVESSVDPSLDAAAVEAVKRWRFKPALKCGKPVAGGVYRLAQRFELAD